MYAYLLIFTASCNPLNMHSLQETSKEAACLVKKRIQNYDDVLCVFSAGYDTAMWAAMTNTTYVFEHNDHFIRIANKRLTSSRLTAKIFKIDYLNDDSITKVLSKNTCDVTVVDSSLNFKKGYHRQRSMQEAVYITKQNGTIFLDDAYRKDEQKQLKRYCTHYDITSTRNGFASCYRFINPS